MNTVTRVLENLANKTRVVVNDKEFRDLVVGYCAAAVCVSVLTRSPNAFLAGLAVVIYVLFSFSYLKMGSDARGAEPPRRGSGGTRFVVGIGALGALVLIRLLIHSCWP